MVMGLCTINIEIDEFLDTTIEIQVETTIIY